jgi:hypothetical protein
MLGGDEGTVVAGGEVSKIIVSYDPFTAAVPTEKRGPGLEKVPSDGDNSLCTHYSVQDLVAV